jgi:hypothetical protein
VAFVSGTKIRMTPNSTTDASITIEGVTVTATRISDARYKFDAAGNLTSTEETAAKQKKITMPANLRWRSMKTQTLRRLVYLRFPLLMVLVISMSVVSRFH